MRNNLNKSEIHSDEIDCIFIPALLQPTVMRYRPAEANPSPCGLATGSLTALMGDDSNSDSDALLSVTFYDVEDRPLTTVSQSHLGGYSVTETAYTDGGLPLEIKTRIIDADGRETVSTVSYSYDRHGRVIDSHLRYGGYPPLKLTANSYDQLGSLSTILTAGLLERTMSYDLHGWLTELAIRGTYFNIGQQLLYADGAEPSYTGRISSKITLHSLPHMTAPTLSKRYDYSYDRLGRLVEARYSHRFGSTPMPDDFSTAYSYDLQGNILTLKRNGLIAPGVYGVVDDLTATFDGNQLLTLTDNASDVLLESSLDLRSGQFSAGSFDYDANGNQTLDLSRSVDEVVYNPLNLPTVVTMADGSTIRYLYTAAGAKLSEIAITTDGDTLSRRDYVSNLEITAKGDILPDRHILLAEGYITLADTTFHAYISDYQGNIIAVYNTKTDEIEQQTDYYPYGLPHADTEASNPQTNRRKYGAKELTTDHGLNLYDFEARHQNPAFSHFTTPDPLAEKYISQSLYNFCSSDPVNRVDPTGKGDYFDNNKYIGTDGIDDGKRYVLNTQTEKFNEGETTASVSGYGLSKEKVKSVKKYIKENKGNPDAFKDNELIQECFTEIESRPEVLTDIDAVAKKDDGKGGKKDSNNQEHGGYINDGQFVEVESGRVSNPKEQPDASIYIPSYGPKVHTHPSSHVTVRISNYDYNYFYQQHPSQADIDNAGGTVNYVIGRRDGKVYLYDANGVRAVVDYKFFIKPIN